MNKHLKIFGIAGLLIFVVLSGCNESRPVSEIIKGEWIASQYTFIYSFILMSDNNKINAVLLTNITTGEISNVNGTYEILDNKLILNLGGVNYSYFYEFIGKDTFGGYSNQQLILTEENSNDSVTYTRPP